MTWTRSLSVCLSFHRVRRAIRIITNPMKRNLGATLTCARSRREISAVCRKMQDEISLPAAFLGRKIPLGKLRSLLSSHTHGKRLFPPSYFLIPLIPCIAYMWYRIEHAIPFSVHYPVHSNKCISRKLHAWLLSSFLFLSFTYLIHIGFNSFAKLFRWSTILQ